MMNCLEEAFSRQLNFLEKPVDIEVLPLRPLDDFLLGSSRFDFPSASSCDYRIKKNLFFYQTNYGVLALLIMVLMMWIHPIEFLFGLLLALIGVMFTILKFIKGVASFAVIFWIFPSTFYCLVLVGSWILISIIVILMHASLRLRNVRNKIANRMGSKRMNRTPMGIILDIFGQNNF